MPGSLTPLRRLARLIGSGLVGCLAAGCSAGPAGPAAPSSAPVPTAPAVSSPATAPAAAGVSKILVIMEENHGTGEVFPSGMPYLWHLARRYGYASGWSAITHPSLPNYLAIFSGSAFNDPPDCGPGPRLRLSGAVRLRPGPGPRQDRPLVRGVDAPAV